MASSYPSWRHIGRAAMKRGREYVRHCGEDSLLARDAFRIAMLAYELDAYSRAAKARVRP